MKQCLEPVDLMVGVGLLATILGGAFLFLAVNGTVLIPLPEAAGGTAAMEPAFDPMESVQVALGQAIVARALGEYQASRQIKESVLGMNRALLSAASLQEEARGGAFRRMAEYGRLTAAQEAMRAQFVMGRRIAAETGRGVQAGLYQSAPLGERYNRRIIRLAERDGLRIERGFATYHEPVVGADIVSGSLAQPRLLALAEQRKGQAIVRVAQAQDAAASLAGTQQQLAALVIAAVHHEQVAERFEALAQAQIPPAEEPVAFSEPKSWDVPGTWLISVGVALMGIFAILIAWSRKPREEAVSEEVPLPEAEEVRFRQAV